MKKNHTNADVVFGSRNTYCCTPFDRSGFDVSLFVVFVATSSWNPIFQFFCTHKMFHLIYFFISIHNIIILQCTYMTNWCYVPYICARKGSHILFVTFFATSKLSWRCWLFLLFHLSTVRLLRLFSCFLFFCCAVKEKKIIRKTKNERKEFDDENALFFCVDANIFYMLYCCIFYIHHDF